jgi:hypothetical protein
MGKEAEISYKLLDQDEKNALPRKVRSWQVKLAGLRQRNLPALERALIVDTALHREFITTRVEMSVVTMVPIIERKRNRHGGSTQLVSWPGSDAILPLIRDSARKICYELE